MSLAKYGKIQFYKIMKTNSRYTSSKRSQSTKVRFKQKYVNASMFQGDSSSVCLQSIQPRDYIVVLLLLFIFTSLNH